MPRYTTDRPYWPHSAPETEPTEPRPSFGPCEGRCNSSWRRAMRAYDDAVEKWAKRGCAGPEPHVPGLDEPWPGDPVFCRRDTAAIRGALRDLPKAYTALAAVKFMTRSASADEERRGRSDVPPSPSPGADQQDALLRLASTWEDVVRQHLGHASATDAFGDPYATLEHAVDYLNSNYTDAIGHPDFGADFGREIQSAHATVVAMVKNKPIRRHLPAPCPSCDMLALVQEEGIAGRPWYVECLERAGGCGRLYAETEYSWLVQLLTGGHVQSSVAA